MQSLSSAPMHLGYLHYLAPAAAALHHVENFARAARALGHRVDVHGLNLETSPSSEAGSGALSRSSVRRALGRYLHQPKELLWNARYWRRELDLLRAQTPDVLLVRHDLLAFSFVRTARRLQLPLVIEANAPVAESHLYDDGYLHLHHLPEWLEGWKLRSCDAITVVSTALERFLAEAHSLPHEKFTVVPNGADVERFHPDLSPDPALPEPFQRAPVVGFVGSFQKFHGAELLVRMVLELAARCPSVHFLLVGDGPEAESVRRETAVLGDRVLLTGRVPHARVPGLVAALDVGVLPETAFYASPLKLAEWMAAGRAIVAPRYGPVEEMIEDEVHGLLFPPRDVEALLGAVQRLVASPQDRERLGRAAAERARSAFTWDENARRMLGACQEALRRHPSKPPR